MEEPAAWPQEGTGGGGEPGPGGSTDSPPSTPTQGELESSVVDKQRKAIRLLRERYARLVKKVQTHEQSRKKKFEDFTTKYKSLQQAFDQSKQGQVEVVNTLCAAVSTALREQLQYALPKNTSVSDDEVRQVVLRKGESKPESYCACGGGEDEWGWEEDDTSGPGERKQGASCGHSAPPQIPSVVLEVQRVLGSGSRGAQQQLSLLARALEQVRSLAHDAALTHLVAARSVAGESSGPSMDARLRQLQQERDAFQRQLQEGGTESLRAQLRQATAQSTSLQAEVSELRSALQQQQQRMAEVQSLQEQVARMETLEAELTAVREQNQQLQATTSQAQDTIEQLRSQMHTAQEAYERLLQENADLQQQSLQSSGTQSEDLQKLRDEMTVLVKQAESDARQIADLHTQISVSAEKLQQTRDAAAEREAQLETQLEEQISVSAAQLQQSQDDAAQRLTQLQEQVSFLQAGVQQDTQELRTALQQQQQETAVAQQELQSLRERCETAEASASMFASHVQTLVEAVTGLRAKSEKAHAELDASTADLKRSQEELLSAQSQLRAASDLAAQHHSTSTSLQESLLDLTEKLQRVEDQRDGLQFSLDEAAAENTQLTEQLTQVRAEMEEMRAQLSAQHSQQHDTELVALREAVGAAQDQNDELEEQLEDTRAAVESAQKQVSQAQEETSQAQAQLRTVTEQLAATEAQHSADVSQLEQAHQQQMADLTQAHSGQVVQMEQTHQEQLMRLRAELETVHTRDQDRERSTTVSLQELQDALDKANAQVAEAQQEVVEAHRQTQQAQTEALKAQAQAEEATQQRAQAEQQAMQAEEAHAVAGRQLAEAEQQCSEAQKAQAQANQQVEEAQVQLQAREASITELQLEIQRVSAELGSVREEAQERLDQQTAMQTQRLEEAQAQAQSHREALEEAQRQLLAAQEAGDEARAATLQAKQETEEARAATRQVQQECAALLEEADQAQKECVELREQADRATEQAVATHKQVQDELQASLMETRDMLREERAHRQQAEAEAKSARAAQQEAQENLEFAMEEKEDEISGLRSEVAVLREKVLLQGAGGADKGQGDGTSGTDGSSSTGSSGDVEILTQRLAASQSTCHELKEQIEALNAAREQLQEKVTAAQEAVRTAEDKLRERTSAAEQTETRLAGELDSAQESIADLQEELDSAEEAAGELRLELERTRNDLQLAQSRQSLHSLQDQQPSEQSDQSNQQSQQMAESINELREHNASLREQLAELKQQLAEQTAAVSERESDLQREVQRAVKLEEDASEMEGKVRALEEQTQTLQEEKQALEQETESVGQQNQTLDQQKQTLEEQNQTLEQQNQDLEQQFQSLLGEKQTWEERFLEEQERLMAETAQAKSRAETARHALAQATEEHTAASSELQALNQEMDQYSQRVSELEGELAAQAERHAATVQEIQGRLEVAQSEGNDSSELSASQLQQAKTQLQDTQAQLQDTQAQLHESQDQVQQAQAQAEEYGAQLQQSREQVEQANAQLQQSQAQLQDVQDQLEQAQRALEQPPSDNADALAELQRQLSAAQHSLSETEEAARQAAVERDQAVVRVEETLAQAKQAEQEHQRALQESDDALSREAGMVSGLQQQLQTAQEQWELERSALQQRVEDALVAVAASKESQTDQKEVDVTATPHVLADTPGQQQPQQQPSSDATSALQHMQAKYATLKGKTKRLVERHQGAKQRLGQMTAQWQQQCELNERLQVQLTRSLQDLRRLKTMVGDGGGDALWFPGAAAPQASKEQADHKDQTDHTDTQEQPSGGDNGADSSSQGSSTPPPEASPVPTAPTTQRTQNNDVTSATAGGVARAFDRTPSEDPIKARFRVALREGILRFTQVKQLKATHSRMIERYVDELSALRQEKVQMVMQERDAAARMQELMEENAQLLRDLTDARNRLTGSSGPEEEGAGDSGAQAAPQSIDGAAPDDVGVSSPVEQHISAVPPADEDVTTKDDTANHNSHEPAEDSSVAPGEDTDAQSVAPEEDARSAGGGGDSGGGGAGGSGVSRQQLKHKLRSVISRNKQLIKLCKNLKSTVLLHRERARELEARLAEVEHHSPPPQDAGDATVGEETAVAEQTAVAGEHSAGGEETERSTDTGHDGATSGTGLSVDTEGVHGVAVDAGSSGVLADVPATTRSNASSSFDRFDTSTDSHHAHADGTTDLQSAETGGVEGEGGGAGAGDGSGGVDASATVPSQEELLASVPPVTQLQNWYQDPSSGLWYAANPEGTVWFQMGQQLKPGVDPNAPEAGEADSWEWVAVQAFPADNANSDQAQEQTAQEQTAQEQAVSGESEAVNGTEGTGGTDGTASDTAGTDVNGTDGTDGDAGGVLETAGDSQSAVVHSDAQHSTQDNAGQPSLEYASADATAAAVDSDPYGLNAYGVSAANGHDNGLDPYGLTSQDDNVYNAANATTASGVDTGSGSVSASPSLVPTQLPADQSAITPEASALTSEMASTPCVATDMAHTALDAARVAQLESQVASLQAKLAQMTQQAAQQSQRMAEISEENHALRQQQTSANGMSSTDGGSGGGGGGGGGGSGGDTTSLLQHLVSLSAVPVCMYAAIQQRDQALAKLNAAVQTYAGQVGYLKAKSEHDALAVKVAEQKAEGAPAATSGSNNDDGAGEGESSEKEGTSWWSRLTGRKKSHVVHLPPPKPEGQREYYDKELKKWVFPDSPDDEDDMADSLPPLPQAPDMKAPEVPAALPSALQFSTQFSDLLRQVDATLARAWSSCDPTPFVPVQLSQVNDQQGAPISWQLGCAPSGGQLGQNAAAPNALWSDAVLRGQNNVAVSGGSSAVGVDAGSVGSVVDVGVGLVGATGSAGATTTTSTTSAVGGAASGAGMSLPPAPNKYSTQSASLTSRYPSMPGLDIDTDSAAQDTSTLVPSIPMPTFGGAMSEDLSGVMGSTATGSESSGESKALGTTHNTDLNDPSAQVNDPNHANSGAQATPGLDNQTGPTDSTDPYGLYGDSGFGDPYGSDPYGTGAYTQEGTGGVYTQAQDASSTATTTTTSTDAPSAISDGHNTMNTSGSHGVSAGAADGAMAPTDTIGSNDGTMNAPSQTVDSTATTTTATSDLPPARGPASGNTAYAGGSGDQGMSENGGGLPPPSQPSTDNGSNPYANTGGGDQGSTAVNPYANPVPDSNNPYANTVSDSNPYANTATTTAATTATSSSGSTANNSAQLTGDAGSGGDGSLPPMHSDASGGSNPYGHANPYGTAGQSGDANAYTQPASTTTTTTTTTTANTTTTTANTTANTAPTYTEPEQPAPPGPVPENFVDPSLLQASAIPQGSLQACYQHAQRLVGELARAEQMLKSFASVTLEWQQSNQQFEKANQELFAHNQALNKANEEFDTAYQQIKAQYDTLQRKITSGQLVSQSAVASSSSGADSSLPPASSSGVGGGAQNHLEQLRVLEQKVSALTAESGELRERRDYYKAQLEKVQQQLPDGPSSPSQYQTPRVNQPSTPNVSAGGAGPGGGKVPFLSALLPTNILVPPTTAGGALVERKSSGMSTSLALSSSEVQLWCSDLAQVLRNIVAAIEDPAERRKVKDAMLASLEKVFDRKLVQRPGDVSFYFSCSRVFTVMVLGVVAATTAAIYGLDVMDETDDGGL